MNVTKNELIKALENLGEFPKTSQKKDELMNQLNEIYDEKSEQLIMIFNIKTYNILKMLVQANKENVEIEEKYEPEVEFLEDILLIDEPISNNKKIHIRFREGMREKITKFINKKNEEYLKKNQAIVNILINMIEVYGIMTDYEMLDVFNKMMDTEMSIGSIYALIHYQMDLRSEITIVESDNEVFFMNCLIQQPEDIIEERCKRDLYYKEYTVEELKKYSLENLINCKQAKELIKFLKDKKIEYSEELVFSIILYTMNVSQVRVEEFMNPIKDDINDINDANEYLQLVMQLYNNIPQYVLYGYSPENLMQMQEQAKEPKRKLGRNEPCYCGSGKKYKNCCMNKVIHVDFSDEKYADCIDEEDSEIFFALKDLLFYYTNQKYHINNELEEFEDFGTADPEEVREIREKVWKNQTVIKEFVKENSNRLSNKLTDILKEWNKKKLNKEFILYKYEDEYTVFMDDENIYYVKGLKERIRDVMSESEVPTIVKTVLLPFKNQIIYDSCIEHFNITFGPGAKKIWDQNYKEMLKQNKVKYQL